MQMQTPNNWQLSSLNDVTLKITDGSHYSPKEDLNGNYKIATVKDLTDFGFNLNGCKRISELDFRKLVAGDCLPKRNDVLLSKDGTMGLVYLQTEDSSVPVLSSIAIIRPNMDIIDPIYLKHYLKWKETQNYLIEGLSSGSALPRIVLKDLKKLPVMYPDLPIQNKIGSILNSIDDKIEMNNKIAKTLEEMAQATFKEWFVNHINDSSTSKIKEYGKVVTGKTPSTKDRNNFGADVPFVTIPDMTRSFVIDTERKLSLQATLKMQSLILPPGSICVSCIATIGLVSITTEPSITNQQINSIIPRKPIYTYFLYQFLKRSKNVLGAVGAGGSTTFIINKTQFENLEVPYVEDSQIAKFHEHLEPMYRKILEVTKENQKLAALRDLLLPKLMKGQIRV